MRWLTLLMCIGLLLAGTCHGSLEDAALLEDNEFAEFEQLDGDENDIPAARPAASLNSMNIISEDSEDDLLVEDEDSEFEHFQDTEEFEGFADEIPETAREQPKITITKMPLLVRARWEAYWVEGLLSLGLLAYAVTFLVGRTRNHSIASTFSRLHKPLLQDNFTLVGEESGTEADGWHKEAEHCYTMWCSGRTCCEGMLLTLKLIKRQDLVHLAIGLLRPTVDTLTIRVELGKDDMDAFVLCVAQKKTAAKISKEMADLSVFCGERRAGDRCGLPEAFSVVSELQEACTALLDMRVCAAIHKYAHLIDYIHISDQYSGPKQTEDTGATKLPECQRVLLLGLIVPCAVSGVEGGCEAVRPMLALLFYMLEKLKRFRLSKEAAMKSDKNRQKVEEAFLRSTHAARQQLAAQRREDKRREEKDRIMAEEDPEKQRRWEKKEQKRQLKKKTPKMKQLKVKAL